MRAVVLACLVLAGCATSEEYVARQGTYDVCRLTMGGPHARAAEVEARNRGIDCAPLYPTIQATEARRSAAALQLMQATQPPSMAVQPYQIPQPVHCQSYRMGNTVQTNCN